MLNVGIIGFGYWGPKLLRNFSANRGFRVVAIADTAPSVRDQLSSSSGIQTFSDPDELLSLEELDAVAIATPVASHYQLARKAIDLGKHVLVEKPLCMSETEAHDLIARAERRRLTLMVDHTFLFTGAVQAIQKLCRKGEIGDLCYVDSIRVNLGLFQPDVNVLWDLAPHDLSIINSLLDGEPLHIEATSYCHVNPNLPDMAFLTLYYPANKIAHLNLSWMSPVKVRRMTIGGTRKMLVWDDLNREEKIKIFNSGIEIRPEEQRSTILPEYRIGDIFSPRVPQHEALAAVVEHFRRVISGEEESILDGRQGIRVVRVLERAQQRLDAQRAHVSSLMESMR
jgi:predicted dehydrogenase